MEKIAPWLTPLILLPGVALLILSTSARYNQLREDYRNRREGDPETLHLQLSRALLFRNTLVSLYVSVGFLAAAVLAAGLVTQLPGNPDLPVLLLTCTGILSLIYAAIQLIRESLLSARLFPDETT
jgi:hypothetical protein